MKYLYLIRHGESDFLRDNPESQRPNDSPLSERGKLQSQKIAEWMAGHNINVVLTSLYQRARQTAEIVAQRSQCGVFCSMALNEYFLRDDGTGVETTEQVYVRASHYLAQFRCNFDKIAIVSHGSLLRTLAAGILNLRYSEAETLFRKPGTALHLRYDWELGDECWGQIQSWRSE